MTPDQFDMLRAILITTGLIGTALVAYGGYTRTAVWGAGTIFGIALFTYIVPDPHPLEALALAAIGSAAGTLVTDAMIRAWG